MNQVKIYYDGETVVIYDAAGKLIAGDFDNFLDAEKWVINHGYELAEINMREEEL